MAFVDIGGIIFHMFLHLLHHHDLISLCLLTWERHNCGTYRSTALEFRVSSVVEAAL